MRVPLVDLQAEYALLRQEILEALDQVFTDMRLYLGPHTEALEREWAEYCSAKHAVAVATGTDALLFALLAAGVGPGDEVITVGWTFVASIEAIIHAGATPVVVDIEPTTMTMDAGRLAEAITPRTRAIMPVHIYGHPADMEPIMELAEARGIFVLEDACQAHGAEYHKRRAGALGHAAAFSFYVTKNLSAYGEGGMVTTNDPELAEKVRLLRNHGRTAKADHGIVGFNGRMQEVQAAILRIKMKYLDDWQQRRRDIAATYAQALSDLPLVLPEEAPGCRHAYHLYVVRCADRDALRATLENAGIGYALHYSTPAHRQPAFQPWGLPEVSLPVTEQA
ncbi:MAG: DegT/DnrJ/EryC1/StrS family aminotransferase, partial [Armatimonadetes bacterium]|nr:DegT/DnrJ/EryC1/StrS family aminotransferase [Armatimonadota bacterium]